MVHAEEDVVIGYAVAGVLAVIVLWLVVAHLRLQWDEWTRLAEQSPTPKPPLAW